MMGASKMFGLLASDRRRRVLLLLCEEEPVSVPDAVQMRGDAARPSANGGRDHDRSRRQTVRLYHADLPKLAAANLIEWNRDAETVSRGPRFGEIEPMLDVLGDNAARVPQEVV
ncbi:hypothetical protein HZS55_06955 [Halosimplex rubrum]|uniref:DUF7344 domain-containing protein n=1 Tax=Halosimplex rubrum TaxID=869889 RepID=A0A7D5T4K6_9EURY|nr:hypothetical protein [Halosimplex rubrum]QLH77049.1 hypothetical protein HZS55_06955 [Halosimplex rubrum]